MGRTAGSWRAVLMAGAMAVSGGEALAKTIACRGGACTGTGRGAAMTGTDGADEIYGRGGNDRIAGGHGDDLLHGARGGDRIVDDGPVLDNDDTRAGAGIDIVRVREGTDTHGPGFVDRGPGPDTVELDADDTSGNCKVANI